MGLKSEGRSGNGLPQHANITKQDQAGPLLELAREQKYVEGLKTNWRSSAEQELCQIGSR